MIEIRGDDGTGARAPEEKRKKREMTSGSHDLPDKYLGITSGGPSAGPVRTVREAVVTNTDSYFKNKMLRHMDL